MKMTKLLTGIIVLVVYAFLTALFITGILWYSPKTVTQNNSTGTGTNASGNSITLNIAEISKHNSADNCWLLISNKIYDVTSFISQHPGGSSTIIPYCGKEATQAFASRGGTGTHSSFADSLLGQYYIGDLGQAINSNLLQNRTSGTQNVTVPGGRGDDDDD